jgi:hypothetical protein
MTHLSCCCALNALPLSCYLSSWSSSSIYFSRLVEHVVSPFSPPYGMYFPCPYIMLHLQPSSH